MPLPAAIVVALASGIAFPVWAEPPAEPAVPSAPVAQHRNLGAIGQSSTPSTPSLPPVTSDRNAAYFNRPGAIPLKSFQPINNAAPTVQQAAPGSLDAGAAVAPPLARPTPPAPAPAVTAVSRGPQPLVRPAPVATRVLKERTRVVPGIIIQPKPAQPQAARVYPAFGQPPRQAGAIQRAPAPAQPSAAGTLQLQAAQTQQVTGQQNVNQQGSNQQGSNQPLPLRAGTIVAPPPIARPGSIQRQAVAPKPYSQTTGSLPTLAPRPHSLFEPPKPKPPLDPTAAKPGTACATGGGSC